MINIKVLGPGCANCRKVEEIARKVVTDLGVEAQIEKVTDYQRMMEYGLLTTPGLVINEQLLVAGRIPSEADVSSWVTNAEAKV